MIELSAVQSSAQTFIHNAILFIDTSECLIQSVGTPYLWIIASNGPYFWADYKI